jgi:quercetin dioxygenase-like cupin family protein
MFWHNFVRATAFLGLQEPPSPSQSSLPSEKPCHSSLIVDVAPDTPQPYVLPNLKGHAIDFGGLILRTLVSNSTSQGSLSLLSVNSGPSGLNLIHAHKEVEAFYALKGSVQVFQNADTGREMRAGDFAMLAPGNNHTYRPNDLDFQLSLCMAPGGIDEFFAEAGAEYDGASPFNPEGHAELNVPKVLGLMPEYNIMPAPRNSIDLDWTNGTTAEGLDTWRQSEQPLPQDGKEAYFLASNFGPKYLYLDRGAVIASLTSPKQTGGVLSVATIALKPASKPQGTHKYKIDQAFQVTEGQLILEIGDETVQLIFGDVVFIPRGTQFRLWSTVGFTKFIVWSAGRGLADEMIERSEPWAFAVWPA